MTLDITKEEAEDIYFSLSCRLGLIETGDPAVRAADVAAGCPGKLRALSTDQMKTIIKMEGIMQKVLQR